jgi:Family of unknown function (DUF6600)/FecR protein
MWRSKLCLFLVLVSTLLLASAFPPVRAAEYSYARIVRLSLVAGDVQVMRPGHKNWEPAAMNMPIQQGFAIGTNEGNAEVQFEDGTTLWIADNSLVQFTELALSNGGRIDRILLAQGTASVYASPDRRDTLAISTPQAEISVPKISLFRIDAFRDGATVSVLQGEVRVKSGDETKLVPKGETLELKGKGAENTILRPNPKPDTWDRFVKSRESFVLSANARSSSYANAPFAYGMADLAAYGNWSYFPGYGYGWQPSGMGNCWAPFMDGNWMSYRGLGWTWVSAEPWGWVPYHFGDWTYSPSYGWFWTPSNLNFWNPAPVQWYQMDNQLAWWPYASPGQQWLSGFENGCSQTQPYLPYNQSGQTSSNPGQPNPKKKPIGKLPVPPRLLLRADSRSLGRGGRVQFVAAGRNGEEFQLLAAPPENGRPPRVLDASDARNSGTMAGSPQNPRVLVPTAADLSRLQNSLRASANGSPAAPMKMPAAPALMRTENSFSFRNEGLAPNSRMRMPSPMSPSRMNSGPGSNPGMGGGMPASASGFGYSAPSFRSSGGSSMGSAPGRGVSPAPVAPAAHPSAGRPR